MQSKIDAQYVSISNNKNRFYYNEKLPKGIKDEQEELIVYAVKYGIDILLHQTDSDYMVDIQHDDCNSTSKIAYHVCYTIDRSNYDSTTIFKTCLARSKHEALRKFIADLVHARLIDLGEELFSTVIRKIALAIKKVEDAVDGDSVESSG